MKKNLLKNERGDLSYFTIFVVLAINMLLSFMLLFTSVKINCINKCQNLRGHVPLAAGSKPKLLHVGSASECRVSACVGSRIH